MIFFQFQDILPLLLWKECKFRMILSENELRFFYQIFFAIFRCPSLFIANSFKIEKFLFGQLLQPPIRKSFVPYPTKKKIPSGNEITSIKFKMNLENQKL